MADIKFSEFPKANQSKDSDEIAILQDGVNKMIASPVLESKIINKTVSRVIEQGGASLNLINPIGVVPTYADLALITPTPELNDAYQVEADGLVYVYTDSGFQSEGDGFVVQPEPIGVVEEGNTQAVSGGEVYQFLTDLYLENHRHVDWENGGIMLNPPGVNTDTSASLRLRSPGLVKGGIVNIICGSGQEARVFLFDENQIAQSYTDYKTSHRELVVDGYFRVLVRYTSNDPILPAEADVKIFEREPFFVTKPELYDEEEVFFQGWENGGITLTPPGWGQNTSTSAANRLRSVDSEKIPAGTVTVTCGSNQECRIYSYNLDGVCVGVTDYADTHTEFVVDGLIRLLVRYKDDSPITPAELDVEIFNKAPKFIRRGELPEIEATKPAHVPPRFASFPFGSMLTASYADKLQFFEDTFDDYPADVVKTSIGFSNDNAHEVFAYTLTPTSYTVTVAVTCHVHGDERHNPVGFAALLREISQPYTKDAFVRWLKDNVRWIVVPIASPLAYIANTRVTQGVNLNRNFDYSFAVTPDSNKGSAPYSQAETRNLRDFFTPLKDEIDFHIDAHDATTAYSYGPFHNTEWPWLEDLKKTTEWLSVVNDAKPYRWPYEGIFGCTSAMFNEVLGIPSITSEHYKAYWTNQLGASNDVQVAKAAEQLAAYLCMFANNFEQLRGSAYYRRLSGKAFASESQGISTWSWGDLHNYCADIPTWTQATESGVQVYTRGSGEPTVMIIAGVTEDDKNSALTATRVMEVIAEMPQHQWLLRAENASLVVIPSINPSGGSESGLTSTLNNLIDTYEPDYVQVIRGLPNSDDVTAMVAETSNFGNFTTYTTEYNRTTLDTPTGVEAAIGLRYTTIRLGNPVAQSFRYGFVVQKWIEACVNDIAAFVKEN